MGSSISANDFIFLLFPFGFPAFQNRLDIAQRALVAADGNLKSFADIYGLDRKVAGAVLGKSVAVATVADDAPTAALPPEPAVPAPQAKNKPPKENVAGDIQVLFGD